MLTTTNSQSSYGGASISSAKVKGNKSTSKHRNSLEIAVIHNLNVGSGGSGETRKPNKGKKVAVNSQNIIMEARTTFQQARDVLNASSPLVKNSEHLAKLTESVSGASNKKPVIHERNIGGVTSGEAILENQTRIRKMNMALSGVQVPNNLPQPKKA